MQQILNDLLVALASFDCHRANGLLTVAVAECQAGNDIRGNLWTRKNLLPHAPAAKLGDSAAKRCLPEVGKPMQGQNPLG
jgi:hypothetical protein